MADPPPQTFPQSQDIEQFGRLTVQSGGSRSKNVQLIIHRWRENREVQPTTTLAAISKVSARYEHCLDCDVKDLTSKESLNNYPTLVATTKRVGVVRVSNFKDHNLLSTFRHPVAATLIQSR